MIAVFRIVKRFLCEIPLDSKKGRLLESAPSWSAIAAPPKYESTMFDIYAYVYAQLKATDIPLDEIVKNCGVPKSTVRWIKNAKTANPRIDTLKKLAKYFESAEKVKK